MIALILFFGLWIFFGQLVQTRFDAVPGDLGDSRFNAIVLEHGFRCLRGDSWHRALWSPNWSFFPHKNVLAYSDNLLGTLPLYALVRLIGLGELAAFNVWVVVISVANFAAMYLMLREVSLSRLGAALGGFVFAFAMPRGEQLNHLQLFPQFFTPLCFLCLSKLRGLRPGAVWCAVGCAVLQFYAAVYVGWFLALALGICAVVTAAIVLCSRKFRRSFTIGVRRLWAHATAATLLAIAALVPLVVHYARAQAEVGPRRYAEMSPMLPRAASYFLPADYTFLYPSLLKLKQGLPVAHEHVMFAGYLVLACTIILLASLIREPRRTADRWWQCVLIAVWLFTVITTLYVDGSLWNVLHQSIPGGGAIRAVSRIVLLQLLTLGAAAAWVATWIQKRAGIALAALFAALVIVENSGTANYHFLAHDHAARMDRIKSELRQDKCEVFFLTGTEDAYKTQLDAMWASLVTKTPTVNGYSGNVPPKWPFESLRNVRPSQLYLWLNRHNAKRGHLCLLSH